MRKAVTVTLTTASVATVVDTTRRRLGADSPAFAFVAVWAPMAGLGTASRRLTLRLPDRWYRIRAFERDGRFYERLGVRMAKAALRRGPLAVFNPGLHLPAEPTRERVAVLDARMREAEASHTILLAATALGTVGVAVGGHRRTALRMLAWNVVMNGYPVMLQRYNRALLARRFAPLP
jgi:Glycosyl-4,4'-diaponeurosporenoate acyltransferase